MTETTVFQSGNSQAVRLPKEFRFKSKTVEIFRRGEEVVLREKKQTMGEVLAAAFKDLPPLTEDDIRSMEQMLRDAEDTKDLLPLDDPDLFGDDADPRTR